LLGKETFSKEHIMFAATWFNVIGLVLLIIAVLAIIFAWPVMKDEDWWPIHASKWLAIFCIVFGGICLAVEHRQEINHGLKNLITKFR